MTARFSRGLSEYEGLLPIDRIPDTPPSRCNQQSSTHGACAPRESPQELSVPVTEPGCNRILLVVGEHVAADLQAQRNASTHVRNAVVKEISFDRDTGE